QPVLELAWEHSDGMRQDRDLAKCAAADVKAPDGLRDRARLPARVRRHQHADRGYSTGTASRHQLRFRREIGVAADEVRGAVEDALVRAPVMRERKPLPRKARPDVFDLGVAPAIDRLLRVADRRDVAEV